MDPAAAPPITIGRIVLFRSRTGDWTAPAIVSGTRDTLAEKGLDLFHASGGTRGVPPLSSRSHVHLVVFTPGLPGEYDTPFVAEGLLRATPMGNTFGEWDVPVDVPEPPVPDRRPGESDIHYETRKAEAAKEPVEQAPGTYRLPVIPGRS